ncbi:response regulator transcription factor [Sulfurospirillum arcachonense]|uniref:response regulator transcription factor n=1 Tax=Sulfurospirillum arcachonense TaxID=57666 RepID=UPI00046A9663|nr:response regulator transcription factor [Sulfurospirillum arcachonense]
MKILLLEDDYLYKVTIKDFLEANEYVVDDYDDGLEALNAIYENSYALLLLDIRVPNFDGYEILKDIRANGVQTPVIMLTSLTDIENLSLGYDLGCSDYLRKPFELKELKYRIEYIIKTHNFKSSENLIKIDEVYSFDTKTKTLLKNEKSIELGAYGIELVSYLVQNRGRYVSLNTLQNVVWEGKDISYADIRMCVKRVREKCDKDFISNKKMVGYKIG